MKDFLPLVLGIRDHWGSHEENTARLLEIRSYALDLTWADRITDPHDPEVILAQREARRSGVKPPRNPIVPPVAMRPEWAARQRMDEFTAALETQQPKPQARVVSLDEWDRAVGLI